MTKSLNVDIKEELSILNFGKNAKIQIWFLRIKNGDMLHLICIKI